MGAHPKQYYFVSPFSAPIVAFGHQQGDGEKDQRLGTQNDPGDINSRLLQHDPKPQKPQDHLYTYIYIIIIIINNNKK